MSERIEWPRFRGWRVCLGCGCQLPREDVHGDTGFCAACEPRTPGEREYAMYVRATENRLPPQERTTVHGAWQSWELLPLAAQEARGDE